MDEELMDIITEENYEVDGTEVVETEVSIEDEEYEILIEETVAAIEVETTEDIVIEMDESIGWVGGDNDRHYSLLGRDERDQHPITAITGLREELDDIEKLQTIFSDKYNHADYYLWKDENTIPEDPNGLFVSFYLTTNNIQVCNNTDDIFGVTVADAGFIGGQDDVVRDYKYGLVVCSGMVSVKCEIDVAVGDSVVSNSYGYATKAKGGYGYKVIGVQDINGVPYAIIPLGISVNQINAMMAEFDTFDTRVGKVETDIVSAINVAQQAYNKSSKADSVSQEALKEALNAIFKAEGAIDKNEELENIITSTNQIAVQAQTIANNAVSEAGMIRSTAEATANDALANVNNLVAELDPITTWTYTDPTTGEKSEGAEHLTTYIKNDVATKAEVATVETLSEENKTLIEENAESFRRLISSVDKYSVGEYSQAYGLSREQAMSILKTGMIYIPTAHYNGEQEVESHYEIFVGESEQQWFTPGGYYEWDGSDWIEYGSSVSFGMNIPTHTEQLQYWYIDSDTAPEGYESYALYIWKDEKWTKVNIYYNNPSNRKVSSISQDVDSISLEIINARGSYAGLDARLSNVDSQLQLATFWNNSEEGKSNLAAIKLNADDDNSALALVVMSKDGEIQLEGASIVLGQNGEKSYIQIDAADVSLKGQTITISAEEVLGIESPYFSVNPDGGKILGFTIGTREDVDINTAEDVTVVYMSSNGRTSYKDDTNGVYIGDDAIGVKGRQGKCYMTSTGRLYANFATIEGDITATSGTIGGCEIVDGTLNVENANFGDVFSNYLTADEISSIYVTTDTLESNYATIETLESDYISTNTLTTKYLTADYINTLDITTNSLVVTGKFSAIVSDSSVLIGGFEVNDSYIRYGNKTAYNEGTTGVYIGTDGIGLGNQKFYVSSSGVMFATGGVIDNCTITNCTLENLTASYIETNVGGNTISTSSGYIELSQSIGYHDYIGLVTGPYYTSTIDQDISLQCGWNPYGTTISAIIGTDLHFINITNNNATLYGTWLGTSSSAITSDKNKKHNIESMSSTYEAVFDSLRPCTYQYNDGTSGRIHTGFIAQEVEEAIISSNLTSNDFAGFVRATCVNLKEDVLEEVCCLRYEEFIALNTWQIQKLKARVTELENKIALLLALN